VGRQKTSADHVGNLRDHCTKFLFHDLPLIFQDPIIITRKLGCQYLWIDSLCIIQDSREDWRKESANMSQIYKPCFLTISAEEALKSHAIIFDGSNKGRDSVTAAQCLAQISCRSSRENMTGKLNWGNLRIEASGPRGLLSSRSWTLQESLLSPRVLDLPNIRRGGSADNLLDGSENFPSQLSSAPEYLRVRSKWDSEETSQITLDMLKPDDYVDSSGTHRPGMDHRKALYAIVNDFAWRSITFSEDKVPAISAAAKEVYHHMKDHYKAGLWLGDIHVGLMRSCPGPGATKTKGYVAPSWSWAFLDFNHKRRSPTHRGYQVYLRTSPTSRDSSECRSWRFLLTTSTTTRLHCGVP
jgi:hypothetical protein